VRDLDVVELTLRLLVAAGAGVVLGLERELHAHPAGVRTHALVAVGAALFTISGAYGFGDMPRAPNVDPARVAAQVASGVGFLGAGAILRQGLGVRGLTTAATLWLAAAIGVASGAGAYAAVALGTAVVLLVLVLLRLAKPWMLRLGTPTTVIELEYERGHGTLGAGDPHPQRLVQQTATLGGRRRGRRLAPGDPVHEHPRPARGAPGHGSSGRAARGPIRTRDEHPR
jgi:putative Mg2+ transporter-C (MgtC) family protein